MTDHELKILTGKEIVSQIQSLLAELQKMEGEDTTPTNTLATLPSADPARFLKKGSFELDLHARHAPTAVPYKTLVKES